MRSTPVTDLENHDPEAVKAIITEAEDFLGGPARMFELLGHSSPRQMRHSWTKNGFPEAVAYALEDVSDGYFDAGHLNFDIQARRKIRVLHKEIDQTKVAS